MSIIEHAEELMDDTEYSYQEDREYIDIESISDEYQELDFE